MFGVAGIELAGPTPARQRVVEPAGPRGQHPADDVRPGEAGVERERRAHRLLGGGRLRRAAPAATPASPAAAPTRGTSAGSRPARSGRATAPRRPVPGPSRRRATAGLRRPAPARPGRRRPPAPSARRAPARRAGRATPSVRTAAARTIGSGSDAAPSSAPKARAVDRPGRRCGRSIGPRPRRRRLALDRRLGRHARAGQPRRCTRWRWRAGPPPACGRRRAGQLRHGRRRHRCPPAYIVVATRVLFGAPRAVAPPRVHLPRRPLRRLVVVAGGARVGHAVGRGGLGHRRLERVVATAHQQPPVDVAHVAVDAAAAGRRRRRGTNARRAAHRSTECGCRGRRRRGW